MLWPLAGGSRRPIWIALALILSISLAAADNKPDVSLLLPGAITVDAKPIATFNKSGSPQVQFGALEWRGGLVLTSPSPNFGGWSGLVIDPDGKKFISISDSGVWLTGELTYTGAHPTGISNARIGPLLGEDGKPFGRKRDRDSEALALAGGTLDKGSLLVAFEQNHRILRYDVDGSGLSTVRGTLALPGEAKAMRRNTGLEAMTVMRGGPYEGTAVALSERFLNGEGNHTGWIWVDGVARRFNVENIGDFDLTDLASLEDGTLFVLERRFRWLEGVKMRLRKISPEELQPGRTAKGTVLIEAASDEEIDNMEGLALSRGPSGETIITMISDDNFNALLQRTVLLQFSLSEPQTAKARSGQ